MATTIEVKYFNTFLIKKLKLVVEADPQPTAPYADVPANYAATLADDWYIEESRIRGGYNNTPVDFGVKAYLDEENPNTQNRFNSMIYSGIFNSRTGVNNTNQFSVGEDITKSADPANGSIQKLYAEDTNLIIFQEDKISRALIDKDAIYSAEGNTSITSTNLVIGQIVAYAGEYGISKDPFSFAVYGYRKYFTDRKRNCIMRLSAMPGGGGNGLTEISSYGMHDFFRDKLSSPNLDKIRGGWDIHTKNYVVSMQNTTNSGGDYKTLSFDETVKGWTSLFDYKPTFMTSLGSNFYSFNYPDPIAVPNPVITSLYQHYSGNYGYFYTKAYDSTVEVILNLEPSLVKNFKTINYEGADGWAVQSITASSGDTAFPVAKWVAQTTLSGIEFNMFSNNFKKKENKFFANLINSSPSTQGEVVFGASSSGIKGFFTTVKMQLINSDYPSTKKELFAISLDVVRSSY